jgi:hypothetical protein
MGLGLFATTDIIVPPIAMLVIYQSYFHMLVQDIPVVIGSFCPTNAPLTPIMG